MAEVDRTLWAGNLSEKVTEELLYELFLQAGPLDKVKIATERDGRQKNFAFITFKHDVSVPYTITLMDGMPLLGRGLRLQSRPGSKHQQQPQQQQQQPHQQLQQQPLPPTVQRSVSMNPYQMSVGSPYRSAQPTHPAAIIVPPGNPYMIVPQSMGQLPIGQQPFSPNLQRSNTWHADDYDSNEADRGRDRDKHSGTHDRDRDRSGHRYDNSGDRRRDRSSHRGDHRGSSNSPHGNYSSNMSSEDFEAKRQKVLSKQEQALERYRQSSRSHQHSSKPWQQDKRRGRY